MEVTILDIDQANLDRGMSLIQKNYKRSRSMSDAQKTAALAQIKPTTDYASLVDCDMVVEVRGNKLVFVATNMHFVVRFICRQLVH